MYISVHNQMSQNAARTNIADTPKAGMIVGPHTASQNGPTSVLADVDTDSLLSQNWPPSPPVC